MRAISQSEVIDYVEHNVGTFHTRRLESLEQLKLHQVLKRKNPYLFKTKNILTSHDLVKTIVDAHLSSQEETLFGEFLEGLAVFICETVYGGRKSAAEGIDLEFEKGNINYIVTIKSGPNWGNSRQVQKLRDDFRKAKRVLSTSRGSRTVTAVNGCCYGRDDAPNKGDYLKLCGQRFWEFISGNESLYLEIIEPLGHKAKLKNDEFHQAYSAILNRFSLQFTEEFCDNGKIDWDKLVKFNSQKRERA
jgi:hypothetical protein